MVRFINCFDVPEGREEEFLTAWKRVNAYMTGKPGYVSHQLNRSLGVGPQAPYRFINYVVWESTQHWADAHDTGFRELVSGPEWAGFTSTPALYEVVHQGGRLEPVAP